MSSSAGAMMGSGGVAGRSSGLDSSSAGAICGKGSSSACVTDCADSTDCADDGTDSTDGFSWRETCMQTSNNVHSKKSKDMTSSSDC